MKFFIDTADVKEIREAHSLGILDGVTTNPSLIAKTGRPFRETIEEICSIVEGPVSAEVVSLDTEGMLKEARELAKIADNIVVKIPLIKNGLKAVKRLTEEGIKTNVTLCFSSNQALLAAKAGDLCQSICRETRRQRAGRYGSDRGDSYHLRQLWIPNGNYCRQHPKSNTRAGCSDDGR